jgi:hypothetical protein
MDILFTTNLQNWIKRMFAAINTTNHSAMTTNELDESVDYQTQETVDGGCETGLRP